jgi:hypothetical protein
MVATPDGSIFEMVPSPLLDTYKSTARVKRLLDKTIKPRTRMALFVRIGRCSFRESRGESLA